MTQKSVAKPSATPSAKPNAAAAPGKVVVFGLDSNWRPHAAWFPPTQAEPARAAAKQLRLNVIEVTNGSAADLIANLPRRPNPCGWSSDGPAGPGRPV